MKHARGVIGQYAPEVDEAKTKEHVKKMGYDGSQIGFFCTKVFKKKSQVLINEIFNGIVNPYLDITMCPILEK